MFDYKLAEVEKKLRGMHGKGFFNKKRVYLFGVSENTRQIIRILRSFPVEPVRVLDNDRKKQGTYCCGVEVVPVEAVPGMGDGKNLYVVCSLYWREMAAQLLDQGVKKENILSLYREESLWECLCQAVRGKRVYDRLTRRYGEAPVFLCPYTGTGDIYLIGTFWKQYTEKNQIEDYVFVVISKACEKAAMLFGIKNIEVLEKKEESCCLIRYYMLCREKVDLKILNDAWGQVHTNTSEWFRGYKGLHFTEVFRRFVFGLPETSQPRHPLIGEMDAKEEETFKSLGLEAGNTVVLSPYSNTLADLPGEFWEELAGRLRGKGLKVCTNSSGEAEPAVKGTAAVFFPLNQAPRWVEKAGYFVGIRSGFCDMVSGAKARKVILYGKNDRFFNASSYEYFNLKGMGLCGDAEEMEFESGDRELCDKVTGALLASRRDGSQDRRGRDKLWQEKAFI